MTKEGGARPMRQWKARASKNAIKEGALRNWREVVKALRQLMKEQRESL